MIVVVKVGTSSTTDERGFLDEPFLQRLVDEVVAARADGHQVVLVVSGAVAAGMPALGLATRPTDVRTLQAIAAVGQPRLMDVIGGLFATHDAVTGQVLLTAFDFVERSQYLHARNTFDRLLELGVVPIVNENDAIAEDEIRFGDNDRIAALVSHLLGAELLVLLTDTPGVLSADPRIDAGATLIEEIVAVDAAIEAIAGGAGTARGSGGMASKLAAAKIAAWSGVRTVIASSREPGALATAISGGAVGTLVHPRAERLDARELWIAFARPAEGRIEIDPGAVTAVVDGNRSLLPVGVRSVEGDFAAGAAIEVAGADGAVVAKGLSRYGAAQLRTVAGLRTDALPEGAPDEVIHRDDLVVLPA